MRQHVRYVVLGVVKASELKELRTQVGAACSGFLEEEKREKGVPNNHPGWPSRWSPPVRGCCGFPRPSSLETRAPKLSVQSSPGPADMGTFRLLG